MIAHRIAVAVARKNALAAGYYVREGRFQDTVDDRLGRWYVGHTGNAFFQPYGPGYSTEGDAWLSTADYLKEDLPAGK